jgi:hypothetical protein
MGHGPLFAIPSSILINPGVTTDALQNIAIYDPNFTGTYSVSIAPGCLSLQQPGVKLEDGNIAVLTVPGQLLNVALLCDVTISDGTSTIEVPFTISATALATLAEARTRFDAIAFRPATLTLDREGAEGSIDVVGGRAPYRISATCPEGTMLQTRSDGARAFLKVLHAERDGVCLVRFTGATNVFGDVPVRVENGRFARPPAGVTPQRSGSNLADEHVRLKAGDERIIPLRGMGPFALSTDCARIAETQLEGSDLRIAARAAGSCSVTGQGASSTNVVTIEVENR